MKIAITVGALLLSIACFAQTPGEKIDIKGNQRFEQNGKRLNPKMILAVMANDPIASSEMKEAQKGYVAASIIGGIGGFMIGGPLGTYAAGGDPNWSILGAGVAISLVSIPFSVNYSKKARASINLYNENIGYPEPINSNNVSYHFNVNGNGLGLKVQF